jgi:hypothetical protein
MIVSELEMPSGNPMFVMLGFMPGIHAFLSVA